MSAVLASPLDKSANIFRIMAWVAPLLFVGILALAHTQMLDWAVAMGRPGLFLAIITPLLVVCVVYTSGAWTWSPASDGPVAAAICGTLLGSVLWFSGGFHLLLDLPGQPTRWHMLRASAKINAIYETAREQGTLSHPDNVWIQQAALSPTVDTVSRAWAIIAPPDRPVKPDRFRSVMALAANAGLGDQPQYRAALARGWLRMSELKALQYATLKRPELARVNAQAGVTYKEFVEL